MMHSNSLKTVQEIGSILKVSNLRPQRVFQKDFDSFEYPLDDNPRILKKRKAFDLQKENLIFLDRNWRLMGLNGHLQSGNGDWALDSFSFPYESEFIKHLPQQNAKKQHLLGLVFHFPNIGWDNYYHVLTELIPRLEFILPLLSQLKIAVPESSPAFTWDILKSLGIKEEEIYLIQDEGTYTADSWVTIPWGLNFIPERFQFLRNELGVLHKRSKHRVFYISRERQMRRNVANEHELQSVLDRYSVEKVNTDEMSFQEQLNLFSEADLLIGPHGAGLSNLLLMPQPKCLEIRPHNYGNECYEHLALASGANSIHVLQTESIDEGLNMNVNVAQFEKALIDAISMV